MESFNAQDWAREFIKHAKENPDMPFDEGAMIGWFANAIMTGYDNARAKYEMVNLNDFLIPGNENFSRPEAININELKRLLIEVTTEILDTRDMAMSFDEKKKQRMRVVRQITQATLNGDDS